MDAGASVKWKVARLRQWSSTTPKLGSGWRPSTSSGSASRVAKPANGALDVLVRLREGDREAAVLAKTTT
jgi:hypothetical protein